MQVEFEHDPNRRLPPTRPVPAPWWYGLMLVLVLVGCMESRSPELETGYGKISKDPTSINGLSILAEKIRQRGIEVTNRKRISPGLDAYDVVIWCPDRKFLPRDEAIEALEQWLSRGYDRTLVYVGASYDAKGDYLQSVIEATPYELREELLRQNAEADLSQKSGEIGFFWSPEPNLDCPWFELEYHPSTGTNQLGGPWMDSTSLSQRPDLKLDTTLKPAPEVSFNYSPAELETLLTINDEPFVYRWVVEDYWETELIVVSDASFLVNFAMVDPAREQLADRLIDEIEFADSVLFLESGPGPIEVSDSDYVNHNSWAWIAERPLRYIVPHFLVWGVIFCFVFFPIFGRPGSTRRRSTTSFRNHVTAVGSQLGRSGNRRAAENRIRRYHELIGERNRGPRPPEMD